MKNTANPSRELPTLEQLETELDREKYKKRYRRVLRSTVYTLVVVAAVAVLVANNWMPVLQIYGASMAPTLDEGDIVISVKGSDFAPVSGWILTLTEMCMWTVSCWTNHT